MTDLTWRKQSGGEWEAEIGEYLLVVEEIDGVTYADPDPRWAVWILWGHPNHQGEEELPDTYGTMIEAMIAAYERALEMIERDQAAEESWAEAMIENRREQRTAERQSWLEARI